jgi:hypothetical protein
MPSVEPFTPSSVNNRRWRRDEMTYLLVFGVEVWKGWVGLPMGSLYNGAF